MRCESRFSWQEQTQNNKRYSMYAKTLSVLLLFFSTLTFAGEKEAKIAIEKGDYPTAIKEYTALAEAGDATSQLILGVAYSMGEVVPRDEKLAEQWARKAALQGKPEAQYLLGYAYEFGDKLGLTKDYLLAANWYRKAADQGSVEAQLRLGLLYYEGLGVKQNYYEAIVWYSKAAKTGNVEAQQVLGIMNYLGNGFPQNYQIASIWLHQAAAQNGADAQALLANMYLHGEGTAKDPVIAYALYGAAIAGNASLKEAALKERAKLSSKMTPQQREEGVLLIAELSKKDNFTHAINSYLANKKQN